MTVKPQVITAEELFELPHRQGSELIKGELRRMPPAGHEHGFTAMELGSRLANFVRDNKLGRVYAAETGFRLTSDPDTVRAPDIAFVSSQRLQGLGSETGYFPGAPDLAIEIISPNDRHNEVEEKVEDWLAHGARMVVTVNPRTRTATVYRSLDNIRMIRGEGRLEGEDVVPGWVLPLAEVFGSL